MAGDRLHARRAAGDRALAARLADPPRGRDQHGRDPERGRPPTRGLSARHDRRRGGRVRAQPPCRRGRHRRNRGGDERVGAKTARGRWPDRVADRARVHGHVGVLRRGQPAAGRRDPAPGGRPRSDAVRHRRHVRPGRQRAPRRRGARLRARPGRDRDQVRPPPRRGRRLHRGRRHAELRAGGLRAQPRAAGGHGARSVSAAPRRPGRADRGDGRRHARAGHGGEGPPNRALGGHRRAAAARRLGGADRDRSERVLPARARGRAGGAARVRAARDRLSRLRAADARADRPPLRQRRRPRPRRQPAPRRVPAPAG